jgi:hypothetical protein
VELRRGLLWRAAYAIVPMSPAPAPSANGRPQRLSRMATEALMNAGPRELGPLLARLETDDDCIAVARRARRDQWSEDIGVSFSEAPIWHCSSTGSCDPGPKTCPERPIASEKARRMTMDERPRLTASEIEAQLLAELQKLPSLRDTQSVRIRPYSGPKGWTWELDSIEPEVGPTQIKFIDIATVVARLQQQYHLDLSPPPPA